MKRLLSVNHWCQCFIQSHSSNSVREHEPQNRYSTKITQPEVRLRVGAFDVGVLIFSAAAILLASVHGKCLHYTEEVDVVFTEKNSSLFTLERGR